MSDVTLIKAIQGDTAQKENQPRFETGMEVEVHQIIREGEKERIQKFKGLIISMRGSSPLTRMITVRSEIDGIGIEKVFPINSPFIADIKVLRKYNIAVKGPLFDTMLAHYLINPDMRHSMDVLAETYLNYAPI